MRRGIAWRESGQGSYLPAKLLFTRPSRPGADLALSVQAGRQAAKPCTVSQAFHTGLTSCFMWTLAYETAVPCDLHTVTCTSRRSLLAC
jgi:hypothetical protein